MTLFVPLAEEKRPLPSPPFLIEPEDHGSAVSGVVKAIMKAKRIIVVCGAGISVHAGIPDFRSPAGLFQTLKRDHPKENLSSGKDLFDASVFNSEQMTALFCQMIAQLSDMSSAASPTPFHQLLRALDDSGKLLRVYTQNIDAIEAKSGLSFGVPAFDDRRHKSRTATLNPDQQGHTSLDPPRCVPLHGTLTRLYCMTCTYSCALTDYLPSLAAGAPPLCPSCSDTAVVRAAEGKRARAIGKLRPSVVLYGEAHADAEGVGDVVRRDLTGVSRRGGPDLLLVAGTSLRVPGTKRIVREFAKAVRAAAGGGEPLPSPRGTPGADAPITSVYLNLDFPAPAREWGEVFDVWVKGDAQAFAGEV
ncbi:DHS-like NAD/FAD-binding domain-containing protein, partial [Schizophyllum fasciatum]